MPRTEKDSRELFDRWSSTYDSDVLKGRGPLAGYEQSLQAAVETVTIVPGAAVLDIGIGTGVFGAALAARGGTVCGLDVSSEMLARCSELHPEFELRPGGFTSNPWESSRFDVVVSSFAFHEVPPAERLQACRELARVTKPGGHACLLDIMFASLTAQEEAREVLGRAWDPDEVYALVGDLDEMLREAGFASMVWMQTAPWHWLVSGRKCLRK
jgi:ubiquinone/menaquinone biosynthesis C-methylase UbiE